MAYKPSHGPSLYKTWLLGMYVSILPSRKNIALYWYTTTAGIIQYECNSSYNIHPSSYLWMINHRVQFSRLII